MSNPATASISAPPPTRALPPRPRRRWLRALRWFVLLLLLGLVSLAIPAVFQLAFRGVVTAVAWSHGARVEMRQVDGSFYEPVVIYNSTWTYRSQAGSLARVELEKAESNFNWAALLPWEGGRWFQRVALIGVAGKIEMTLHDAADHGLAEPAPGSSSSPRFALPEGTWWPTPAVIEARGVDLIIQTGENFIRMQESQWTVSEWESGVVEAGQIVVQQPWLKRTFRNVHGTTALRGSTVLIADLQLDREVQVKSLAAELKEMAKGVLDFDILIEAFGGEIRTQAKTIPATRHVQLSAVTNFSKINIAALATFLGASEAAGGIVESGTFNFYGAPSDFARSTSSIRFTARDFQWDSRQWDSLIVGAALREEHVQIPEFELHQGQNELTLNGNFALPQSGTPWWQAEFAANVSARIDNLTNLSALVLPDFKYAAGKVRLTGSISGKEQKFHGQVLVSGNDLTWRSAPIKELNAALMLNGNELQLAYFDLINRDDYVHGRGVINILGAKQYWGELRASVEDLALYSSFLQKPIVPEPLAGGAVLNWSGEGSADRYSGTFFARLQKLRSLGATGTRLHPVNAELEGVYAPDSIQFSRFAVADNTSSFSAKVQVGPQSVDVRDIRLTQGMEQRLEGGALLPLDVWSAWRSGDLGQLVSATIPTQFNLKASNLRLAEALRLSGWNWPLDGSVTGEITGGGAGPALEMQGSVALREGTLPLGWNGDMLNQVSADFTLAGHQLTLAQASATHASGKYEANGTIDLGSLRDPAYDLALSSDQAEVQLLPTLALPAVLGLDTTKRLGLKAVSALQLQLRGPASAATLSGDIAISHFTTNEPLDLQPLWVAGATSLPVLADWKGEPWAGYKLDLLCHIAPPAFSQGGLWSGEVRLTGTGAAPEMAGILTLDTSTILAGALGEAAIPMVKSNGFPLYVTAGSIVFREGVPIDPTIDFTFEGSLHAFPFHASIVGPLSNRIAFIDSEEARQILQASSPLGLSGSDFPGLGTSPASGWLRPASNPGSTAQDKPKVPAPPAEAPAPPALPDPAP